MLIRADSIQTGYLEYQMVLEFSDRKITYPAGVEGAPGDWDFYARDSWKTRVVLKDARIHLFDAKLHSGMITGPGRFARYSIVPSDDPAKSRLEVRTRNLKNREHDKSIKYYFRNHLEGRKNDLKGKHQLIISGSSLEERPLKIQLALIMTDGSAYGKILELSPTMQRHTLSLNDLQKVKLVLLPNAYPAMMPYWFDHPNPLPFNIADVESLQISIGPGIRESDYGSPHGYSLERIWLE